MKVLKWLLLVLLLLLVVALAVLWTLPAQRAWGMVAERFPELVIERMSGTIWDGDARRVQLHGYPLGRLQWQLSAWPLLRSELDLAVELSDGTVTGSSQLRARRDGWLRLEQLNLTLPAQLLQPVLDVPAVEPLGRIEVMAQWLQIEPGRTPMAQGQALWPDAAISGAAQVSLGEVRVDYAPGGDNQLLGEISNQGGAIEVLGSFELIGREYEAEILLTPRRDDPALREGLSYLGAPQPDGSTILRVSGTLALPGAL